MGVNRNSAPPRRLRFEAHWHLISWAVLDKSLPLAYGVVFLLVVVRSLPQEEFGLQTVASAVLLTVSQLLKALLLVPMIKFEAEGRAPERVAATGSLLYAAACGLAALGLWAGSDLWARLFSKPALAAVLVPTAVMLAAGSGRDAANASLEGLRRLRSVFFLDLAYYAVSIGGLLAWRGSDLPRRADTVQWVQAAASGLGSLLSLWAARRLLAARPGRAEARRIGGFGVYFFGSSLGATLAQQADTLLAGALMSARDVAAYGAAKLLFRAFNLVAQSINQVLMPVVSRLHAGGRRDDLRVLYEKSVCFVHLGIVPACALLLVATPWLFDLLFRGRYAGSEPVFRVLVASALTLPLASIGSPFLTGMGAVRALLWMTWAGVGLGLALAAAWIPGHGPLGAAWAMLVAAVFGMLVRTAWLKRALGFTAAGVVGRVRDAADFARRRLRGLNRRRAGG
jgi:O-antigen/teichoic acid export membrane protein